MLALLLLTPLTDTRPSSIQSRYDHAYQLFLHGDLIKSQQEAEQGYRRLLNSNREWAAKFQLLEARALIWRGMNEDALRLLAATPSIFDSKESVIHSLTLAGIAYTYLNRLEEANQKLIEARNLCQPAACDACVQVPSRRGVLALRQGQVAEARQLFLESLSLARAQNDRSSEAGTLVNLGRTALQAERYDEAVDWSKSAYRAAMQLGQKDRAEAVLGNLGWAYYKLGDNERALEFDLEAEQAASKLGSYRNEIKWLANAGLIYQERGDSSHAVQVYQRSLELATQIHSPEDIITALEDLALNSVETGKLNEAGEYLNRLTSEVRKNGNHVEELNVMLAQGTIAAARGQDEQAETSFRNIEHDPASPTSLRLGANYQLSRLYEAEGKVAAANRLYETTLSGYEAARAELKHEDSKLPFLANATPVYDDYIHFLVKQGRTDEALAAADRSRAQTLAQGLGLSIDKPPFKAAAVRSTEIARKTGATVLFYWLGTEQSYLWAITRQKTSLFTLPGQAGITHLITRYSKELVEPAIAGGSFNDDGLALYRMLVAPAASLIPPHGNVVVVSDGSLSLLNFETLVVPQTVSWAGSGSGYGSGPHYWIEDANIVSAPSLYMLASARPARSAKGKLLLVGDAVSPNPDDYPDLPMAGAEMKKIETHFVSNAQTVFARQAANSTSYLESPLRDYAYIHFVAHGVASRTDPLDSAIILSRTGAEEDSFKLHARQIIQHRIDARLVTISACYGGGTRSYAGEGLVGLSWAFLRAGAHNVIGALWEVSDTSTPQLMDALYRGIESGLAPSAALRQAKLELLHSGGVFREPFYWAPFQIYTGL
jgi:CHAT domain-containing protein/Tfp pilus assembly protein PilF